jgi:LPXTG-site transpeptidase (sortase) family protein
MDFKEQPQQAVRYAKTTQAVAVNTPATAAQTRVAWPVHLTIAKIAVDAPLDYVRLTPQGALDTPDSPANAGWYDGGSRPGEKGTAVIDGHFGWKDGIPAVFDQLHKLSPGDLIQVKDERGQMISFAVRELRTYQKDQADKEVFATNDDKVHLNLITCEGTWNEAQKSYTNRLVVFADKL